MKARPFFLCLVLWITPVSAAALVWPDVAERVERDLSAADAATRRAAARDLALMGAARGTPLALTALSDSDDEVRLAAADAAIRLRAIPATDAMASWLNAPDARLRRKACDVARALPSARAVAPLARTLGDPDPEVRSAAADALGYQSSADAVPALLGRLDDPAPAVRIQVVLALARLGDVRSVVPLVGKVQDSSPEVRQAVARALGDLGDSRASPALVLALRDPNDDVRRDALAALGRIGANDAVDAIAPFVGDRTPSLRLAAFGALGRIATPDAVRLLVGALGSGDDAPDSLDRSAVRDALVAAAAASVPRLHALLGGSPSLPQATGAAWVLGEVHAYGEASTIVAALRRGTLPPAAALHALARAGRSPEVPVVLEFLADGNPIVRREAIDAADALLDPKHPDGLAVEPLAALLRDPHLTAQERPRIAGLLGRTGAPRAAALLVLLVRAQDVALRLAAIDALGTLGPADADEALLAEIGSSDAAVRLRAAVALSEAGGPRAREALLDQLDGGEEIDRAAVLTALGGVLARTPTDGAVTRLQRGLESSAGAERDAIVEAIGRTSLPAAVRALALAAGGSEPADRQAAATLLAGHADDPGAVTVARMLLGDADDGVLAQAAWSLSSIGDASDIARLDAIVRAPNIDPAINAAAGIGRIAARLRSPDLAGRFLCPHVTDPRAYVRANTLTGLALAGARCGDGSSERNALAQDPNEDTRAAAALAVARSPSVEDHHALARCARTDPSGSVAARCLARPPTPERTHAALVYVIAEGFAAPRPGGAYALLLADGMIRVGTTDRRGATFDPVAPEGRARLRPASAVAR